MGNCKGCGASRKIAGQIWPMENFCSDACLENHEKRLQELEDLHKNVCATLTYCSVIELNKKDRYSNQTVEVVRMVIRLLEGREDA